MPAPDREASNLASRRLQSMIDSVPASDGAGVKLRRSLGRAQELRHDPFLMLDEFFSDNPDDYLAGFPSHPHRGFETVTYMLDGHMRHEDSEGNRGDLGPGDVQWMTAARGIIHSEMPSSRIQTEGGFSHGLQLWVNLPADLRRTAPKYQALPAASITSLSGDGWAAELVAGSMFGARGPAETHTPIGYARVTIQPGAMLRIPTVDGHTAAVYAFDGSGTAGDGGAQLDAHHLAIFERTAGDIVLSVPPGASTALDCIVLTGEPIGEPIARYGPFVMNTPAEIDEAIGDFNAGRMGSIPATGAV